jgi:hypothetical protein
MGQRLGQGLADEAGAQQAPADRLVVHVLLLFALDALEPAPGRPQFPGMNAKVLKPVAIPASLTVVAALAQLLQRLELSPVPVAADQYRSVVQRLTEALREAPSGEALDALLAALPAAAELYENLNYQHAGLCRSPLEASLNAELAARQAIARVAG